MPLDAGTRVMETSTSKTTAGSGVTFPRLL